MTALDIMKTHKIWAVVGASENKERYSYKIYKLLKEKNYTVYPVSPKYETIDGDKAYKSLSDLPEKPEVVNFVVNPTIGLRVVNECANLEVKHIWLQPGTESDELIESAKSLGISVTEACVLVVGKYL